MLQRLRKRCKGKRGFTLIELMIVIMIIGILAAFIIPTFITYKEKHQAEKKAADKAEITQKYEQKTNPKAPEPRPPVVPGKKSGEMKKI